MNDKDFETKNRKNRCVAIPDRLKEKLVEYMDTWVDIHNMAVYKRTRNQRVYLFCDKEGNKLLSFRKAFDRHLKRLDIEDATIHTMRHTYASHLVMNGVSIRTVQELLGHHSIKVTEKYAHLSDNHKQEAVKSLMF